MSVLILKNIEREGPGTIEDYLQSNGISYRIVNGASERIPDGEFETLVMMGGPMSVNDTGLYPHLQKEIELAAGYMESGKRVLGICLGAQIMAKALGAPVYAGPGPEIGWYHIELLGAGLTDPVMTQVARQPVSGEFTRQFRVFHWHGETFDLPAGAARLAQSVLYPNQAFRYGDSSYAFQFHLEVTREMIYDWLNDEAIDKQQLKSDTEMFYEEYAGRALSFYKAFFR